MSLTLSVMIILMGSGILMMHCNHSGKTRIITYEKVCEKKCKPTAPCMTLTVLKLSTMNQSYHQTLEHVVPVTLVPMPEKSVFNFINPISITREVVRYADRYRCGPPRDYLNLICVLLI